MFPASAGMNRTVDGGLRLWVHVPRERGDEPILRRMKPTGLLCSPRARG